MLKLANQILDIYDDVTKDGIRKIAAFFPDVEVLSLEKRAELDPTEFGLTLITKEAGVLNKFPIADKDSTLISNYYFDMNHKNLPIEAQKIAAYHIKQACDRFGVKTASSVEALAPDDVLSNLYYEKEIGSVKTASVIEIDLSDFAQIEKIASNQTSAQYIMSTPSRVKLAEQYFTDYHKKIPVELRTKYARAIQIRANELGMQKIGGVVGKYASDHYSSHVDAHLEKRASLLDAKPVMRQVLKKFAAMKDLWSAQEFAQNLYAFDKQAGLTKYYDGYLQNAYETVLGLENPKPAVLFKTASKSLSDDQLKMIVSSKFDKIKEYFGKNVADELKKDPQTIFEGLPLDHKEVLVNIANGQL